MSPEHIEPIPPSKDEDLNKKIEYTNETIERMNKLIDTIYIRVYEGKEEKSILERILFLETYMNEVTNKKILNLELQIKNNRERVWWAFSTLVFACSGTAIFLIDRWEFIKRAIGIVNQNSP